MHYLTLVTIQKAAQLRVDRRKILKIMLFLSHRDFAANVLRHPFFLLDQARKAEEILAVTFSPRQGTLSQHTVPLWIRFGGGVCTTSKLNFKGI